MMRPEEAAAAAEESTEKVAPPLTTAEIEHKAKCVLEYTKMPMEGLVSSSVCLIEQPSGGRLSAFMEVLNARISGMEEDGTQPKLRLEALLRIFKKKNDCESRARAVLDSVSPEGSAVQAVADFRTALVNSARGANAAVMALVDGKIDGINKINLQPALFDAFRYFLGECARAVASPPPTPLYTKVIKKTKDDQRFPDFNLTPWVQEIIRAYVYRPDDIAEDRYVASLLVLLKHIHTIVGETAKTVMTPNTKANQFLCFLFYLTQYKESSECEIVGASKLSSIIGCLKQVATLDKPARGACIQRLKHSLLAQQPHDFGAAVPLGEATKSRSDSAAPPPLPTEPPPSFDDEYVVSL